MTELRSVNREEPGLPPAGGKPEENKAARHSGYRPTRQGRSAESERRLLEAAEALFRKHGYTHTRVSEIIRLSGVSTGSFYHRFGDKAGLKDVLAARFLDASRKQIAEMDLSRATHTNLRAMLRWLAGAIMAAMDRNLGIYRVVDELSKTEPEKWEAFRVLGEEIRDRVLATMDDYRDELSLPEAELQAALTNVVQLNISILLQTRLGAAAMFPRDREALLDMLVRASMGILRPGE